MRAGRSRWRGRSWRAAGSSHEAPEEDLFLKGASGLTSCLDMFEN